MTRCHFCLWQDETIETARINPKWSKDPKNIENCSRTASLTLKHQILEGFLTSILNSVGVQYGLQDNLSFWPPKTMWLWWILNEINDFIGAPALKRCSPRSHKSRLEKLAKWPISSIDVTLLSVILGLDYTSEWVVPVTQTFVFQFFEVCIFSDWLLQLILIDYSSP